MKLASMKARLRRLMGSRLGWAVLLCLVGLAVVSVARLEPAVAQATPAFRFDLLPNSHGMNGRYWFEERAGTTASDALIIRNLDATRTIEMTVALSGSSSFPVDSTWFVPSQSNGIIVPPGQSVQIDFELRIPENLAPRAYRGVVEVVMVRYTEANGGGVTFRTGIGRVLNLTVIPPLEDDWYEIQSPLAP